MKKTLTTIFIILFVLALAPVVQAGLGLNNAFGDGSVIEKVSKRSGFITNSENSLEDTISSIINLVLSFLGIVFIILFIYAGANWMLAGGNEEKVGKSKKLIKQAVIGLIIVLVSYALSYFIINSLGFLVN
ncbi:MAG: hypothetical protein PF488_00720 [Patescibacteria group bacterium]|jgi:hypothetical protein|nr:hypothetical protein [Patescibacteria group bacterium]